MGKRKSARKPVVKKKAKLDSQFDCLFCNHEKSIKVTMKKGDPVALLECTKCGVKFQSPIHKLSGPIDVYSDWIDACEDAKKKALREQQSDDNPSSAYQDAAAGRGTSSRRPAQYSDDELPDPTDIVAPPTGSPSHRGISQYDELEDELF